MLFSCNHPGFVILLLVFVGSRVFGDEPERIWLWDEKAPGAIGEADKDRPSLMKYSPGSNDATRTAIVIFPGGGYGHLAMDHEGEQVARWLNANGIHAFVCDYRHRGKGYGHPAPMIDAQRAIRTVRANATEFEIDPKRIGVLGFSAGGHLASTTATHFDSGNDESDDPIEQRSCRPDFAILCYPVIAMGEPYSHKGSERNLLGKNATGEQKRSMSNHHHVTKTTPPTFLWHTAEDSSVPPENSIVFFRALQAAAVSAELHVYAKGGHGIGLAAGKPGSENWPASCLDWLTEQKLIEGK